jgi:N-methylhydantoinase A
VNLRVTGIGPIRRPQLTEYPDRAEPSRTGVRQVCFDDAGYRPTPLYDRTGLSPGNRISGPAVIEEFGSTVPLHPGFTAELDRYGNLLITKDDAR